MTFAQASAFLLVGAMMALFVWGRLRHDLVAMLALLAGGVAPIWTEIAPLVHRLGADGVLIVATEGMGITFINS